MSRIWDDASLCGCMVSSMVVVKVSEYVKTLSARRQGIFNIRTECPLLSMRDYDLQWEVFS